MHRVGQVPNYHIELFFAVLELQPTTLDSNVNIIVYINLHMLRNANKTSSFLGSFQLEEGSNLLEP